MTENIIPTKDERIKATVRHLMEVLQRFGDPAKPGKVIPWPKKKEPQPKPGPF
jgi:hypothetical protein